VNAVWRVARAAVRRRRLQTIVIGVVVGISTATMVLALGLLVSSSAPFDRAYAQQSGAHLVAAFDGAKVSDSQLTQAADRSEVEAVSNPFGQVTLDTAGSDYPFLTTLNTVGRADPGGQVDRLDVWQGRWATKPGEIVLSMTPGSTGLVNVGAQLAIPGRPVLTVVGFAYSVSHSADAWVTPDQMAGLRPTAIQMLYRFTHAATAAEVSSDQAAVTAGLPSVALLGSQSYLTLKQQVTSESGVYIPFLVVFGILGLAVAVLIVANVISGAVVAGFRNIGMLKALGFTPNQVMAVYLVMVTVPSVIGCVLGTVLGNLVARPILTDAFQGFGTSDVGIDLWVDAAALLGMPAVVVLAALVSALRARRLPAAEAISAGSAPRVGRALLVQRWLAGTRLPRSVSLGLGVPFARPARSLLTLAAVVLGVMTVTLATGVTMSVTAYRNAVQPSQPDRIELQAGMVDRGPRPVPEESGAGAASTGPKLSDAADEALLRSLPGTVQVAAVSSQPVVVVGGQPAGVSFYRGDTAGLGPQVLKGHWPDGPGEVSVPSRFLNQRGLAVGDTITVELDGNRAQVRIVGVVLTNPADDIFSNWETLALLAPNARAGSYQVQLEPGTDQQAYLAAVEAGDPGLLASPSSAHSSSQAVVLISSATLLTLVLGVVAALGVFNTVVLNARERRRDLGMLKSIGMTPRQVTVMMVTSMGALGVVGGLLGLPFGVVTHRLIAPAMMQAGQSDVLDIVMNVYHPPMLTLLALAGVLIAVLGAFIPARAAARTTIAEVLHNE
jgi:putative ABC transport system permease protein